jgi:hypothetical protein
MRQALSQHPGQPLEIEDPVTQTRYVILPIDLYERMQGMLEYDDSEPDPREFYPSFFEAVKEDLDAPGMELYDDYDAHRNQT